MVRVRVKLTRLGGSLVLLALFSADAAPLNVIHPSKDVALAHAQTQACLESPAPVGAGIPAQGFDLSEWKVQLDLPKCDGTPADQGVREVKNPELQTFSSDKFFVNATDGGLSFIVDVGGATTGGTTYPRTELREMHEWSLAQGSHSLNESISVHALPPGKPEVAVAQIKTSWRAPGATTSQKPVLKMRAKAFTPRVRTYRGNYCRSWCAARSTAWSRKCTWSSGNCVACAECPPPEEPGVQLEARVKQADGSETSIDFGVVGWGEPFNLVSQMEAMVLTVSVDKLDGSGPTTRVHSYADIAPYSTTTEPVYYFKTGNYCQSNLQYDEQGATCEVRVHSMSISHSE